MTRAAALALLAALMSTSVRGQETPRFRSVIEAVRVDVLATRGGEPVMGLTAADFEVRDNGVLQDVTLLGAGATAVSAAIVLDLSASLTDEALARLQRACSALVSRLLPGDAAALVTFTHMVRIDQPLTTELNRIPLSLTRALMPGGTALIDATHAGIALAQTGGSRGLAVLFSDGVDTSSWLSPGGVIDAAKVSDVVVYGVTPVSRPSESRRRSNEFLRSIIDTTGGNLRELREGEDLEKHFARILEEFRMRYVLTYTPKGVSRPGWHRLDVRVKRRGVSARARLGYMVPDGGSTSR